MQSSGSKLAAMVAALYMAEIGHCRDRAYRYIYASRVTIYGILAISLGLAVCSDVGGGV